MKRSIVGGELGFVKKRRVSPPAGTNTGPRRNTEDERFKGREEDEEKIKIKMCEDVKMCQ